MIPTAIENLMKYISKNEEAQDYLSLAIESVFGEISDAYNLDNIVDLENLLGETYFSQVYPVMLEFFFTNIYGADGEWNIIDSFLKSRKDGLTKSDKAYLNALRPSVMSLYEVVGIEPGKSLTVRDMIRGGAPVSVKEKSLTNYVAQWDCLGLRVLDMGTHLEFAGGCLQLNRKTAEPLAVWLKEMRDLTLMAISPKDVSMTKDNIRHYAEVLWTSEIAQAWMEDLTQARDRTPKQLSNHDGHLISPVVVCFPIIKKSKDIEKFLDGHKEFERVEPDAWLWLEQAKGRKKTKEPSTIRGHVFLDGDFLELHTNSRERANILEDLIERNLSAFLEEPEREYTTAPSGSLEAFSSGLVESKDNNEDMFKPEEIEEMLFQVKDKHYHQWIKDRIPALGDKTPKMAKRSKKGRAELIALLKDIENSENHQAKAQGIKPYDISWMWKELGLDRNEA